MKLYVGNLNESTSEKDLSVLFESVAEPMTVKIIKDRDSGRSRGFGFVEFESQNDGNDIISKFNGYSMNGYQLKVNEARERNERSQRSRYSW